jgi:hypothetical protein
VSLVADVAEQPLAGSFGGVEIRNALYQAPYIEAVTDRTEKRISQRVLPLILVPLEGRTTVAALGRRVVGIAMAVEITLGIREQTNVTSQIH